MEAGLSPTAIATSLGLQPGCWAWMDSTFSLTESCKKPLWSEDKEGEMVHEGEDHKDCLTRISLARSFPLKRVARALVTGLEEVGGTRPLAINIWVARALTVPLVASLEVGETRPLPLALHTSMAVATGASEGQLGYNGHI